MKIINRSITTLALVALCLAASSVMAAGDAGGLTTDAVSTVKSYYDLAFAVAPWIAAIAILIAILFVKMIGVGYTLWIIFACVVIGAIPLIITSTGLSLT